MKKIISIIPARGGSKRLPRKNIMNLCGKPLIAYTIEASIKSGIAERTIVLTDDKEIKEISLKYGSEVFDRPSELARDDSPTIDIVKHIIKTLEEKEKYFPGIIVLLQPVSPLKNSEDIKQAYDIFNKSKFGSVVSVTESSPLWNFSLKNDFVSPILIKKIKMQEFISH